MKYTLHSYVQRPARPACSWSNKIKLVLLIVLLCEQKASETVEKSTGPNPRQGRAHQLALGSSQPPLIYAHSLTLST